MHHWEFPVWHSVAMGFFGVAFRGTMLTGVKVATSLLGSPVHHWESPVWQSEAPRDHPQNRAGTCKQPGSETAKKGKIHIIL